MRYGRRFLVLVSAVVLSLAACGSGETDTASAGSDVGVEDALTGEFATLDGSTVDLADYRNSDLVVCFWAPW